MAELEKVIKGLECCVGSKKVDECGWEDGDYKECPYNGNTNGCVFRLMKDALSLLKAQEPVTPEEYTVVVSQYGNAEHKCYRCGACKCGLIRNSKWKQKYCPECGRAVKWDE